MVRRRLGCTDLELSPIGFGAFKIGRNEGIKYERAYMLPTDDEVGKLLRGVLDLGINYIDTAPAYGVSEERLGALLPKNRQELVISTKVGETFADGTSHYDFSAPALRASIDRSRSRLRVSALDLVFIHSDGNDSQVLHRTDAVATLLSMRAEGAIRSIGFSGKTAEGALAALDWADALMVEYHLNDRSHQSVIAAAAARNVGVVIKKPLASGRLAPDQALPFLLGNPGITSLVIGTLNLHHLRANAELASAAVPGD